MSGRSDRFEEIIAQLRQILESSSEETTNKNAKTTDITEGLSPSDIISLIRGARRIRNQMFGVRLFGEPAWDILLELHAAYHRGASISVSAAVTFGETPPTTGLRWLAVLETRGLIERRNDSEDARRQFVGLTSEAAERLDEYARAFGLWAATRASMKKRGSPDV